MHATHHTPSRNRFKMYPSSHALFGKVELRGKESISGFRCKILTHFYKHLLVTTDSYTHVHAHTVHAHTRSLFVNFCFPKTLLHIHLSHIHTHMHEYIDLTVFLCVVGVFWMHRVLLHRLLCQIPPEGGTEAPQNDPHSGEHSLVCI